MNLSAYILKLFGWSVTITVPDLPKAIICVAPHTSNWDFVLGKLAYAAAGRKAGFLMKKDWFVWPLGLIFRAIGGVPVERSRKTNLTDTLIKKFEQSDSLVLAITPEGTRSRTCKWHTGFLHIARTAHVPLMLGAIDYAKKTITIAREFVPGADIESDMKAIKNYYRGFSGRYPDKFCAD